MGRRRAWLICAVALLAGCASKNVAERATLSQELQLANGTFVCSKKLPEGAQLVRECVLKDQLQRAYDQAEELYVLYQAYMAQK